MRIIHWFRKDLRLDDNTALAAAHRDSGGDVVTAYVSEPVILARPDMAATRIRFVLDSLDELSRRIAAAGGRLVLRHGAAAETLLALAREARADAVYYNAEYEPDLAARDEEVRRALTTAGIQVRAFHDRFLVTPGDVLTGAGHPYTVYTPFRKACEQRPVAPLEPAVTRFTDPGLPTRSPATLEALGLATSQPRWPAGAAAARRALDDFCRSALFDYVPDRDRLDKPGTSQLSPHLRFGTLSPRQAYHAVSAALEERPRRGGTGGAGPRSDRGAPAGAGGADADPADARKSVEHYISELRWRDFYGHVLHHFPRVVASAFKPRYDGIRWVDDAESFEAWCLGRTGYPVVDAAMRQLAGTGWMHNRARMIVASFLTKDLLIDWRKGERWFMNHLVDGDPASNNGGWQWAASTGTDAQPWFRIFNPVLQGKRFDPEGDYVRRWVPELAALPASLIHDPWKATPLELAAAGVVIGVHYPAPVCDHHERREMALALYGEAR